MLDNNVLDKIIGGREAPEGFGRELNDGQTNKSVEIRDEAEGWDGLSGYICKQDMRGNVKSINIKIKLY